LEHLATGLIRENDDWRLRLTAFGGDLAEKVDNRDSQQSLDLPMPQSPIEWRNPAIDRSSINRQSSIANRHWDADSAILCTSDAHSDAPG